MANNQNVNKVVYDGTTLIDLTGDDVTAGDVLSGKKFHLPSGAQAFGTMAGGTTDVFMATYGATTYADILAAYNAGKSIYVKRELNGETLYALHVKKTDGSFYFRTFSTATSTVYGCTIASDGTWSVNSYALALLSSPTFTGTPKAPTAAAGTNNTQIATTAFVKTAISSRAAPSSALSLTLASGSWSSATPAAQTVTAAGVTSGNHIVVGIASSITAEQYDAAAAAKLVCTAQGTDSITVTALGDKPTVNIPISVVILG